ncbi:SDR family NAD(P)-dependent oxidoreductase [Streptomyces sp. NPDC059271]|uniref:SDR family NAD(P)-dependent oxidoreductase n=1 Tax=Streptomyces sp. NPDC059271 TaxID=3346799 RepID=UPI0036BB99FE
MSNPASVRRVGCSKLTYQFCSPRPSPAGTLDHPGRRRIRHHDLVHRWLRRHPHAGTPYAVSKGGINQLVRTLAAEWAEHHIRVYAVAPGYVANILNSVTAHDAPSSDWRINTFTPVGRRATVEEIAAPYAFLASPAAGYITGSVLAADGRYTAT